MLKSASGSLILLAGNFARVPTDLLVLLHCLQQGNTELMNQEASYTQAFIFAAARGLSGKYPAILNISITGRVALI
jgi:hypothetical protein